MAGSWSRSLRDAGVRSPSMGGSFHDRMADVIALKSNQNALDRQSAERIGGMRYDRSSPSPTAGTETDTTPVNPAVSPQPPTTPPTTGLAAGANPAKRPIFGFRGNYGDPQFMPPDTPEYTPWGQ